MKKEVAFAIVIGLVLGLVVTFGIYTARQAAEPSVAKSAELLASTTPDGGPNPVLNAPNSSLVVISPEDGLITNAKEVQVSGTTLPDALVLMFYNDQYKIEQ